HTERLGAIQDSRCYLMNGGAVESFFISEDTPVGSVIGTLSVNGDPAEEQGDISLRLQEKGAAVGIAAGTKNLTLLRALDREERRGPSNVYVNVRCDRRRTTDPSFIIPVSVRVWDVNDNAPQWVGAPYRVRLSELTAPGTRVAVGARALDADQPGPHATIHYSVLPGPNHLDSVLVVKKPLDYETLNNFTVTLRAQDAGTPPLHNDTVLQVQVLDADDQNPKFTHEHYTATLPEDAKEGTILETSPGPISAADQDVGINAPLQYSATGDNGRLLVVDKDTGQVTATKQLIEELSQPITIVIKATQVDNSDRYALATLSVARAVARGGGVRFRRRQYSAAVSEAAAPGHTLLTLHTAPPPAHLTHNNLQFYVSDRSFLDKFAINSAGEVVLRRPLDYETADSYHYQVMVTDGVSNDTASINITVLNVNEWEPRFRYPQYEFRVEEDPQDDVELLPVGKLDVFDGDKRDTVTLSLRGSGADMLYVNASGDMFLRGAALRSLNSSVLHVVATAVDSGAPPRQTSVPVTVHLSERLLQAGGGAGSVASAGGAGPVMAVFACALAALALLVCALLGYIYRVRRRSKRSAGGSGTGYVTHEKPLADPITPTSHPTSAASNTHVAGSTGATGAAGTLPTSGSTGALRPAGSSGSLLSVSAGASTILANSTSSLDLQQEQQNATQGAQPNSVSSGRQSGRGGRARVSPAAAVSQMSDHLCARAAGGRSGVAWPAATIPARVKKLSWDDAAPAHTHVRQRGRADGRDQPRGGRPHEPHRLLLTGAAPPPDVTSDHDAGTKTYPEMSDTKPAQDSSKYNQGDNDSKSEKKVLHDRYAESEHKSNIGNAMTSSNVASMNNVPLPGSTTKNYYPASPAKTDPLTAALNTVGVPVYSNPVPESYLFTSHHDPAHYYIPGLSEPSSPSNYPTMLMPHPGHPSHAIVFDNESRPPRSRPIPTHILVTASKNKRTKHLKPPSNSKLKTKPVTILTPVTFPVQSTSQSALFHPTSNYAAPMPTSHVRHPAAGHAQTKQNEPISTITGTHYSTPPSAPMLLEEDPAPLCASSLPPAYATIDPKKLRAMHIRPAVFKRGAVSNNRQYQLL
ncbi:hypothetical protein SFRURICE_006952, partial [Spodoptera frugiperda]